MNTEIIIVSGLPRSGTSLMMQMLENGGVGVVTDGLRTADTDNPRGYYEFERVKKIKTDTAWLAESRGKAVKMVSQLLYDLPATEAYRIIFMDRDLDEVLLSQEKMLLRLGRSTAPRAAMKQAFLLHLERLHEWLPQQRHLTLLRISYNELVERPRTQAERVREFLGSTTDLEGMAATVDPFLYRNRNVARNPT